MADGVSPRPLRVDPITAMMRNGSPVHSSQAHQRQAGG
jgi:hypothetical protein